MKFTPFPISVPMELSRRDKIALKVFESLMLNKNEYDSEDHLIRAALRVADKLIKKLDE